LIQDPEILVIPDLIRDPGLSVIANLGTPSCGNLGSKSSNVLTMTTLKHIILFGETY
jgi:hypothetical protein